MLCACYSHGSQVLVNTYTIPRHKSTTNSSTHPKRKRKKSGRTQHSSFLSIPQFVLPESKDTPIGALSSSLSMLLFHSTKATSTMLSLSWFCCWFMSYNNQYAPSFLHPPPEQKGIYTQTKLWSEASLVACLTVIDRILHQSAGTLFIVASPVTMCLWEGTTWQNHLMDWEPHDIMMYRIQ